jgi:hypothetical protein
MACGGMTCCFSMDCMGSTQRPFLGYRIPLQMRTGFTQTTTCILVVTAWATRQLSNWYAALCKFHLPKVPACVCVALEQSFNSELSLAAGMHQPPSTRGPYAATEPPESTEPPEPRLWRLHPEPPHAIAHAHGCRTEPVRPGSGCHDGNQEPSIWHAEPGTGCAHE